MVLAVVLFFLFVVLVLATLGSENGGLIPIAGAVVAQVGPLWIRGGRFKVVNPRFFNNVRCRVAV